MTTHTTTRPRRRPSRLADENRRLKTQLKKKDRFAALTGITGLIAGFIASQAWGILFFASNLPLCY